MILQSNIFLHFLLSRWFPVASHKLLLLETSLKSIISYVMGTHRLGGYTNLTDNRLRQKMIPFPNGYFIIPAIFISLNIFCMIACRLRAFQFVVAVCLCYPSSFIVHKYLPSYKTTYLPLPAIIIIILICDILWLCVTLLCIL